MSLLADADLLEPQALLGAAAAAFGLGLLPAREGPHALLVDVPAYKHTFAQASLHTKRLCVKLLVACGHSTMKGVKTGQNDSMPEVSHRMCVVKCCMQHLLLHFVACDLLLFEYSMTLQYQSTYTVCNIVLCSRTPLQDLQGLGEQMQVIASDSHLYAKYELIW